MLKTKIEECNIFYKLSEGRLIAYNKDKPLVTISIKYSDNHLTIFNTEPTSMESTLLLIRLQMLLEHGNNKTLISKEEFIEEVNKLVKQILE